MNESESNPVRKIKIACPSCSQKIDVSELPAFMHIQCPTCKEPLIVPKWFNNYLLEDIKGKGGMAIIYRALDITLDREVAIKVIDRSQVGNAVPSEYFLHEAKLAAAINHVAIVSIYSCGIFENAPYIVMEYMEGGNLEERLKQFHNKLPIQIVLKWFLQICEGLENAHAHGVIHHDIKPSNILLDPNTNAKLSDFGLAQVMVNSSEEQKNQQKQLKNWMSPLYVSPEKILSGEEGAEGDIYSLGATFYHLFTGVAPFTNNDTAELMRMRLDIRPSHPNTLRNDIPAKLSQLLMNMLNTNPVYRPKISEIIRQTKQIQEELGYNESDQYITGKRSVKKFSNLTQNRKIYANGIRTRSLTHKRKKSYTGLLLLLFFIVSCSSFLLLYPKYCNLRKLYNYLPFMDKVMGPLSDENSVSFVDLSNQATIHNISYYSEKAEDVFFNPDSPLNERLSAAWLISINALLQQSPNAMNLIKDMHDQISLSVTEKRNIDIRADFHLVHALLEPGAQKPNLCYFSKEQLMRLEIGKFLRTLYNTDKQSVSKHAILKNFTPVQNSLTNLEDELETDSDSWSYAIFNQRIKIWNETIHNGIKKNINIEPIFINTLPQETNALDSSF